jgi:hypothetical protein
MHYKQHASLPSCRVRVCEQNRCQNIYQSNMENLAGSSDVQTFSRLIETFLIQVHMWINDLKGSFAFLKDQFRKMRGRSTYKNHISSRPGLMLASM